MGSTLATLKQKLSYAVGTSETNLMTEDKRTNAINEAIIDILSKYNIPQYTIPANISFINGVATLPSDCLVLQLLDDPNNVYTTYEIVDFDIFRYNNAYTATIQYDENTNVEQILKYPADSATLRIYYTKMPIALADSSDRVRFNIWWDKAIAEKAAEQLFINTRNFNAAAAKQVTADEMISRAWQVERARLQGPSEQKLHSVFSRKRSLLWNFSRTRN